MIKLAAMEFATPGQPNRVRFNAVEPSPLARDGQKVLRKEARVVNLILQP